MHVHRWSFVGPLARDAVTAEGTAAFVCKRVDCDGPNELRCMEPGCGDVLYVRCGSTRSVVCGPCGLRHRGRVATVAMSGFRGRKAETRFRKRRVISTAGLFVTLTAMGVQAHALPGGRPCRCTPVGGIDTAKWNAASGKNFNEFIKAMRREYGEDLEYFKSCEVQERGALHFHILFKRRGGGVLMMTDAKVRRLAMDYGFGHECEVLPYTVKRAHYVAKYAAKSADDRPNVPWRGIAHKTIREVAPEYVVPYTGEIIAEHVVDVRTVVEESTHPTYRTWTASRAWGDSMREVRVAQGHWAALMLLLPAWAGGFDGSAWAWSSDAGVRRSVSLAPPQLAAPFIGPLECPEPAVWRRCPCPVCIDLRAARLAARRALRTGVVA